MKIFKRFIKNSKSDRGDSLVTAIIVFPLIVILLVTGIDFGVYLNNKSSIMNAARDGARTVAILGGNEPNAISDRYGVDSSEAMVGYSVTESQILNTLDNSSLIQTQIDDVICAPERTNAVGQDVTCEVIWSYQGLPMSSLNLVSLAQSDEEDSKGLGFTNRTVGHASAETSVQG